MHPSGVGGRSRRSVAITLTKARGCAMISSAALQFRHIALEGRSASQDRDGRTADPRLARSSAMPTIRSCSLRRSSAPRSTQLFYLLSRHRQQVVRAADLFSQVTIRLPLRQDKIFAYLNLDDNELFIYQRLYELLSATSRRRPLHPAPTDVRGGG